MIRKIVPLLALAVLPSVRGQTSSPTIYAESFRQGATRITEEIFDVKLTPENATYRERIKDSRGEDRYELTIFPQGPEGDTKITSWHVALRDLHHTAFNNVLAMPQNPLQDSTQDSTQDSRRNLCSLDPNQFGSVPIRAKRIFKVDAFYVVFQVNALHFTPLESPYLDSMAVKFAFSNSDPRSSKP
jgi:hypothetical protein